MASRGGKETTQSQDDQNKQPNSSGKGNHGSQQSHSSESQLPRTLEKQVKGITTNQEQGSNLPEQIVWFHTNEMESVKQVVEFSKQIDWQKAARELDQFLAQDQSLSDYDTVPEHSYRHDQRSLQKAFKEKDEKIEELQIQLEQKDKMLKEKVKNNEELERMLTSSDSEEEHSHRHDQRSLQKAFKEKDEKIEELQIQLEQKDKMLKEKVKNNEELERMLTSSDSVRVKSSATTDNIKNKKLEKEIEKLQTALEDEKHSMKKLKEDVRVHIANLKKSHEDTLVAFQISASEEIEKKEKHIKIIETQNEDLQRNSTHLKDELQETQTRLSKLMSTKVTDNNPDIADLSDTNRPNKLAERYAELYDNQWSDAFDALKKDEKTNVQILLEILKMARQFCEGEAEAQTKNLENALFTVKNRTPLPDGIRKEIKDIKKAMIPYNVDVMQKRFSENCLHREYEQFCPELVSYAYECVNVCWIMVLSDPPIVFGQETQFGDPFDANLYKPYTRRGDRWDYIVWPALLMSESGALVTKGVAQPMRSIESERKKTSSRRPQTADVGSIPGFGMNKQNKASLSSSVRNASGSVYGHSSSVRNASGSIHDLSSSVRNAPSGTYKKSQYSQNYFWRK